MIKRILKWLKKIFKRDECAYNFMAMNLPEPLNETEEARLIKLVGEKNLDARNKLIEHNLRLVVFISKKFESPKLMLEDLISIGSIGLIKGIETFKNDKNIKLATYCSRCIENEILMFLRKISKQKLEISLDETLNIDADGNELVLADILGTDDGLILDDVIKKEKRRVMYESIDKLTSREKEILTLRFGLYNHKEMTQKEVADYLGISQSYISRLEKKTIDKLKVILTEKLELKR